MTRIRSLLIRYRSPSLAAGACLLAAVLAGCSSSPPLFLNGRPTRQVQCPAAGDRDSCTQQARAQCNGDYDVVGGSNNDGVYTLVFACRAH
jgi:hypothetical protein